MIQTLREHESDTIAAIATPVGEGGIGIVRLSGRQAIAIASLVFFPKNKKPIELMESYTACFGQVLDESHRVVDEGVLLLMRSPKTYTTEDLVEIQLHGSSAVLARTLELLLARGARLAGKGEFTQRAFLHGRIDLLQAEAVLDLIQAKTDQARRWATAQLQGVFSSRVNAMKNELLLVLSHLEAALDFPDESLDTQSHDQILRKLETLRTQLDKLLQSSEAGILAKKGLRVALMGRPNAGKSSLMNRLVRHSRVIVTPVAGTTRDVVEEEIRVRDYPVRLCDTAGIQESENPIEQEGVRRSRKAAESADLILYVVDASMPCAQEDRELLKETAIRKTILVLNKSDLPCHFDAEGLRRQKPLRCVSMSCLSGQGLEDLEDAIVQEAFGGGLEASEEMVVSSVRHKEVLIRIRALVNESMEACQRRQSPELVAVGIREALDCLGLLVGDVVTDDLLDVLFSQFCIGK